MLLGERLQLEHYVGIGLATLGVFVLSAREGRTMMRHSRLSIILIASVIASSLSLVIQDYVFTLTSYWNGITGYACGILFGAFVMTFICGKQEVIPTFKRCWKPILAAELFTLCATFTELRAVDLSPSASLVVVIATSIPMMIMLVSFLVWVAMRMLPNVETGMLLALREQFVAAPVKLLGNALIIGGIYIITASVLSH